MLINYYKYSHNPAIKTKNQKNIIKQLFKNAVCKWQVSKINEIEKINSKFKKLKIKLLKSSIWSKESRAGFHLNLRSYFK